MGKIATESYAASKGGGSTSTGNKCCTKSRAESLGCKVSGSYSSNQLVQETDLSKNATTISVGFVSSKIQALSYDVSIYDGPMIGTDGDFVKSFSGSSTNNSNQWLKDMMGGNQYVWVFGQCDIANTPKLTGKIGSKNFASKTTMQLVMRIRTVTI